MSRTVAATSPWWSRNLAWWNSLWVSFYSPGGDPCTVPPTVVGTVAAEPSAPHHHGHGGRLLCSVQHLGHCHCPLHCVNCTTAYSERESEGVQYGFPNVEAASAAASAAAQHPPCAGRIITIRVAAAALTLAYEPTHTPESTACCWWWWWWWWWWATTGSQPAGGSTS